MTKNEERLASPGDFLHAIALLTRLPVPNATAHRGARAAWAYPLAGLVAGGLAALAGLVAYALGLPAPLTALVSLAALIVITGAMHEDGLADAADGLWGGYDRARRLEIMRDSRIGTFGTIALVLGLTARWAALWLLFADGPGTATAAMICAAMVSRAALPILMSALPAARDDGLSKSVGQVPGATAVLGAATACLLSLLLVGGAIFPVVFWAGLTIIVLGAVAQAKLGGQTGDVLGGVQQLAEIAVLFSLAA